MYKQLQLFTANECVWMLGHAQDYINSTVSYDWGRTKHLTGLASSRDRISEQCNFGQPKGPLHDLLLEKFKVFNFVNLDGTYLSFVRYYQGGFFAKHIDGPERYTTAIIQLSNEEDYSGGQLFVKDTEVSRTQGTTVHFDANTEHELKLVTEGQRDALVVWSVKGNLKLKNTLL
jgi:hypothetical protein